MRRESQRRSTNRVNFRLLFDAALAFSLGAVSLCASVFLLVYLDGVPHLHPIPAQMDFYNRLLFLSDNSIQPHALITGLIVGHCLAGGLVGIRARQITASVRDRHLGLGTKFVACSIILPLQAASVLLLMDVSLQSWIESSIGFPSDKQLISNFQNTRPQLDKIVATLRQNRSLDRIGVSQDDGDKNEDGLPILKGDQIRPYRLLLRYAGVPRASIVWDGGIRFPIWASPTISDSGGELEHGVSKGYEYRKNPPETTIGSLSGFNLPSQENETVYRHIEGNWYLYYDCWHGHEVAANFPNRESPSFLPVQHARAIISEALMDTNLENSVRPLSNTVAARSGNGSGAGNGGIEQITRRLPA